MGAETIIAGIASGLGVGTAAATAIYLVAQTLVMTALAKVMAKTPKGSPDLSARTITSRGTVDPAKIIYGETVVAGTLAYRNAHGTKNREMWAVHVLAGHECEEISDCYLDSKVITAAQINSGAAAGGVVGSGEFAPVRGQTVCAVYKHLGTSTQTANSALVAASSDWTTDHRLRGHAYCVTEFVLWDKTSKIWDNSDPTNVKFRVKGKKIYDPRLDSTQIIDSTTSPITYGTGAHRVDTPSTWEWSDCPPLCVADYLMDTKFSPFNGGLDASRIDWESVAKAADDCDALVFIPPAASPQNTEKRYTCNGVIYGSETGEENISRLLSSFNGELICSNGLYIINAGVYEAPSSSIDEDDIIGPISVGNALEMDERINTLKATYIDPDRSYEATETAAIELYKDERDAGQMLADTVELPLTNSWYMAQRICLLRLQQANQEMTLNVPCNLRAARLQPGQRINLTLTERGWTPKVFRVLGWEFYDRGEGGENKIGVNLSLREDDSTAYGDPQISDYNTTNSAGELTLADPDPVPGLGSLPQGIKVGEGSWNIELVKDSDDGTSDTNDGEIYFNAGTYLLPDGTSRVLSTGGAVYTPYEGTNVPPDQVGYIVWGVTDPVTRFTSSPEYIFGAASTEAAGLFAAIYDRYADQWYAVDDGGNEIAFTPAATDYIVARFLKTTTTGGIDFLTALVSYVDSPLAPPLGTNLIPVGLDTFGTQHSDAYLNSELTYAGGTGSVALSAVQELFDNQSILFSSDGTADYVFLGSTVTDYNIALKGSTKYVVSAWVYASGIPTGYLQIRLRENHDAGYQSVSVQGQLSAGSWVRVYGVVTTESAATAGILSFWSSSSGALTYYIDGVMIEEFPGSFPNPVPSTFTRSGQGSTRNTGSLADQDTIGQDDVDLGALTQVNVAESTGPVAIEGTSYVEVETVAITMPASITNTLVQVDIVCDIVGNGLPAYPPESDFTDILVRLLDEDDAVVDSCSFEFWVSIDDSTAMLKKHSGSYRFAYTFLFDSTYLNASVSNTFKVEMRESTATITSIDAEDIRMRVIAQHQADTA